MLNPGAFEDRQNLHIRLMGIRVAIIVVFVVLAVNFWMLQVVNWARYFERAENNHMRTIPLRAPRGVLYDRHGAVLVRNHYSRTISIVREQSLDLNEAIRRLALATGVDESRIRGSIQRRLSEPAFRPIALIEHATDAQVAAVMARTYELPEVRVDQVPTRTYPEGLAAHLFGYVGEIQDSQLARPEFAGREAGAIVGQAGIELIHNAELMGTDGSRFVRVNSRGREIEELQKQDPVDGQRVQLTIDLDMQRALEEGFRANGYDGAAVFMDPRNGEVLALTSLPAYDPNDFAMGIDRATWAGLTTDPKKPLQNRLVQGLYSPGSTFKIIMAVAALEEGVITPDSTVDCYGSKVFWGNSFACHKKGGHGRVNVRQALEQSCNVFFYTMGERLSIDIIHKWATKLGLVGKTGIDLPNEKESFVASTAWATEKRGSRWYPGETISVAIGQGAVDATPIGMATMMATVANGGTLITPHLLKALDRGDGKGWASQAALPARSEFFMNPINLSAIRDGLWMAVNSPSGTATSRGRILGKDVAGKTGTAQVISLEGAKAAAGKTTKNLNDHGWFVFFAPKDNPQVAGVVFTEHSKHGYLAAPIAKHVMETFFAKQEGRPLPVYPKPAVVATTTPVTPAPPPVRQPSRGR